jgi:hypothetical protein
MISAIQNQGDIEIVLGNTLGEKWVTWSDIIQSANSDQALLQNEECLLEISFILKIHERMAFAIKQPFFPALAKIFQDMIELYVFYSRQVVEQFNHGGKAVLSFSQNKKMRGVRKDILKLMTTYVHGTMEPQFVTENFIGPMFPILEDYANSIDELKSFSLPCRI